MSSKGKVVSRRIAVQRLGKIFLAGTLSLLLADCTRVNELPSGTRPQFPDKSGPPRPAEKIDRELERTIAEIANEAKGKVGVAAVLLETGDAAYLDRTGQFAMQSVYKVPIAMAAVKTIDERKTRIDTGIIIRPNDFVRRGYHSPIRNLNPHGTIMPLGEVIWFSLSESDGTASDVLLELAGGPAAVQQYLHSIGISNIVIANSTKEISRDWETQYRNWATPEASIELMRAIIQRRAGLSEQTTNLIMGALRDTNTGRRRIRRGLPEGATLAHKTGTGGRPSEIPGNKVNTNLNSNAALNGNKTVSNTNKIAGSRTPANSKAPGGQKRRPTPTPRSSPTPADDVEMADDATHEITSATNDVGIITLPDGRRIIIAVYIQDSTADGPTREKVIADITRAVCERWAPSSNPVSGIVNNEK